MPEPSPHNFRDQELLTRIGRGDIAAFGEFYSLYKDFVHRIALRYARDEAEALDAVQDVFASIASKPPVIRVGTRTSTYLFAMARNAALALRRRTLRCTTIDESLSPAVEPANRVANGALDEAVAALPDEQRDVLLMRVVDEMSVEEVAIALGVPEGTVKSRLHAAMARLRSNPQLSEFFELE